MSSSLLIAERLYKSYGAIKAVDGISIRVERGQSLCIQGRSGCGKTTLLKILSLILKPDNGNVMIEGVDTSKSSEREIAGLKRRLGFSFQEPLLLPYLNALQNLFLVVSPVRGRGSKGLQQEAAELLSKLGLSKRLEHLPRKLSVGEKKRVDLARAVLKSPSLIIADEPFSNLDPDTSKMVAKVLEHYRESQGALLYSCTEPSHSRFADECVRIDDLRN